MQNLQKELKSEILKLCWYMRGGVSVNEGFNLSYEERSLITDIIQDNMEVTKKSGLPFF
tara:strand:- start:2945 stop:3121 length:177 start_codon:yes stop_codon:yes gene_type:complete